MKRVKNKVSFNVSKSNEDGSALLMILVVAVILSIVSFSMISEFNSQLNSVNTVAAKNEVAALITDMRVSLSDQNSCKRTFRGHNPNITPSGTITNIYRVIGSVDTDVGVTESDDIVEFIANADESLATTYGNGEVKILGFELNSSAFSIIGANIAGTTELIVYLLGVKSGYARHKQRRITLNVKTDVIGMIDTCGVGSTM